MHNVSAQSQRQFQGNKSRHYPKDSSHWANDNLINRVGDEVCGPNILIFRFQAVNYPRGQMNELSEAQTRPQI